jgi:putative phage-type endonuclease
MLTPEQLVERRGFLGASECASSIGLSPFFSQVELYLDKIGDGEAIETTIPMMVGTALEPVCISLFERERHLEVECRQQIFVDETTPWRRCTVDGYLLGEDAIIEAKTSGDFRGWGDGEDDVPQHYLYNAQHSMACIKEAKCVHFPVLIGGRTFRTFTVQRDQELIDLIKKAEHEFMELVRKRRPPKPTTVEDVVKLYPRDNGLMVTADALIEQKVKDLVTVKANIKQADETRLALLAQITAFMGAASTLKRMTLTGVAGEIIATWNSQDTRRVDNDLLRTKHPEIAREVTRVDTSRVFRTKGKGA